MRSVKSFQSLRICECVDVWMWMLEEEAFGFCLVFKYTWFVHWDGVKCGYCCSRCSFVICMLQCGWMSWSLWLFIRQLHSEPPIWHQNVHTVHNINNKKSSILCVHKQTELKRKREQEKARAYVNEYNLRIRLTGLMACIVSYRGKRTSHLLFALLPLACELARRFSDGGFSSWRTFRECNNVLCLFLARSHAKPSNRFVNWRRRQRRWQRQGQRQRWQHQQQWQKVLQMENMELLVRRKTTKY